jgi:hypothetical protein
MSRTYEQLIDGEGSTVPAGQKFKFACCDCGLVHDMVLVPDENGKEIGIAVQRNKRATGQRRRQMKAHDAP